MKNVIEYLEKLDLSKTEARLYITLLESGPISVRDLASLTEMKRTTAYLYIEHLVVKGLIIKLVHGTKKLIAANDPEESLPLLMKKKVESARIAQREFPNLLQYINTTLPQQKDSGDAEIKYYKGKNGVKKIYEDALSSNEIRSYVNIAEIEDIFPENVKLFDDAFNNNPQLRMYEIVESSPESHERMAKAKKRTNYNFKVLPKTIKLTAQDILIYDGKVGIINLKDNIHGVILHNADFYNNFKVIFDFFWKIVPSK